MAALKLKSFWMLLFAHRDLRSLCEWCVCECVCVCVRGWHRSGFPNLSRLAPTKQNLVPLLCQIMTPARLLPPSIGRFRVRCGGGVRIRLSGSDFKERGNHLSGLENGHNTVPIPLKKLGENPVSFQSQNNNSHSRDVFFGRICQLQ